MRIEGTAPIEVVGEHEIDLLVVQLLETSPEFRDWLLAQADPAVEPASYLGAITHASYAGEGESDVEFGELFPGVEEIAQ